MYNLVLVYTPVAYQLLKKKRNKVNYNILMLSQIEGSAKVQHN